MRALRMILLAAGLLLGAVACDYGYAYDEDPASLAGDQEEDLGSADFALRTDESGSEGSGALVSSVPQIQPGTATGTGVGSNGVRISHPDPKPWLPQ
jgi:hypothetical protein